MTLTNLDLFSGTREGLNYSQTHALVGKLLRGTSEQALAAGDGDANSLFIARCAPLQQDSGSPSISFVSAKTATANETLRIDVLLVRGGITSSILSAPYTFDSSSPADSIIDLSALINPAKMPLLAGDVLKCSRTYTGGSSPSMANNSLIVEPRPTVIIPNGGGAV